MHPFVYGARTSYLKQVKTNVPDVVPGARPADIGQGATMNRLLATGAALAAAWLAVAPLTAQQDVALKDLMPRGMAIGVAINQRQSDGVDATAVDIIAKQFNQISPENLLKFQLVHPAADRYEFTAQDRYVQFGLDRKMQVVGHNLVWHRQTPAWVFRGANGQPADRETLLARMRDHIHTLVGRYKGKIYGWDVVNEAIDEDGSLRKAPWRDGIGDDYVAKAFESPTRPTRTPSCTTTITTSKSRPSERA